MDETLDILTLAAAMRSNPDAAVQLYRAAGGATAVMDNRRNLRDILPACPQRVVDALADIGEARRRAESEMEYAMRCGVKTLCLGDGDYPQRLKDCPDAPLVLFYKGTAALNRSRVINMVGTRRCTAYGQDCVRTFVRRLGELCPDVLIVSGLAYGIDICSHREALACGIDTVAVLAHGLDNLYPPRHKDTATQMTAQSKSMSTGVTKPNSRRLARIWLICLTPCFLALFA